MLLFGRADAVYALRKMIMLSPRPILASTPLPRDPNEIGEAGAHRGASMYSCREKGGGGNVTILA